MKYFYQLLIRHFRNLLLIKIAGKERELLDMADNEIDFLRRQTENVPAETLQRLLGILMAEEENVRRSQVPRINIEAVVVRMAYLEPALPIGKILAKMEGLEKRLAGGGPAYPDEASLSVKKPPKVGEDSGNYEAGGRSNSGTIWEDYKSFVKKQSSPLWSKIEPGKFLGYENNCLRIGFSRDYIFFDDINEKSQKDRLGEISKAFFGEDMTVRIESLGADAANGLRRVPNGGASTRINDVKRDVLNHPLLQKVLDVFGGAVVREVIARTNHK
jgi:DNA polymerase-3 subunit gamma/tau